MKKINLKKYPYIILSIVIIFLLYQPIWSWYDSKKAMYSYSQTYSANIKSFMLCLLNHSSFTNNVFPVGKSFEFDRNVYNLIAYEIPKSNDWLFFSEDYKFDLWGNAYLMQINKSGTTNNYEVNVWSKGPNRKDDKGKKDDIVIDDYNFKEWLKKSLLSF